ncbi:hypothetical protein SDC9_95177 [bioreactor metagenome]|uniref:Uncharacterized protein n=1 Tax=bioreactor metagenome TaxID=1076179 RepID=A0A645A5U2_9ZZZZ
MLITNGILCVCDVAVAVIGVGFNCILLPVAGHIIVVNLILLQKPIHLVIVIIRMVQIKQERIRNIIAWCDLCRFTPGHIVIIRRHSAHGVGNPDEESSLVIGVCRYVPKLICIGCDIAGPVVGFGGCN